MLHTNVNKDRIQKIKKIVRHHMGKDSTGHDYYHALRVWHNSKLLSEGLNIDLEVVEISALIHDLIDDKLDNRMTLDEVYEMLKQFNLEGDRIKHIIEIINNISFRKNVNKDKLSLEAKIVQDADRLDALGAIGIARAFSYSGKKGNMIYDPEIKPKTDERVNSTTAINHFYEKLFKLKDDMNTEKARKIAEHREQFMRQFLKEFFKEWNNE